MFPEYLGDGVYAVFDGWHIWLRLNSHDNTEGQIALEPSVYAALVRYHDRLAKLEASREESELEP
jgi:hypothetical protein